MMNTPTREQAVAELRDARDAVRLLEELTARVRHRRDHAIRQALKAGVPTRQVASEVGASTNTIRRAMYAARPRPGRCQECGCFTDHPLCAVCASALADRVLTPAERELFARLMSAC